MSWGCSPTTTRPDAPKPWGRDFTTSRAWITDAEAADSRKGLSGFFYNACEVAWAVFVLTALMILAKRLLVIIAESLAGRPLGG